MYIVTLDRPYYPHVQYFETREEAQAEFDRIRKQEHDEGGMHACFVAIAQVIDRAPMTTHY